MESETNLENQWVIVTLNEDLFALPGIQVQELVRLGSVTPVPLTPSFVMGVMNLRGRITTILRLSERVGIQEDHYGTDPRVVIVNHQNTLVGLCVSKIIDIAQEIPLEPNSIPGHLPDHLKAYIQGVIEWHRELIPVLDIHLLLES